MPQNHTDSRYEERLGELRKRLLVMAGRVEEMITDAVYALVNHDVSLAQKTIEVDKFVNRDEIEIDEICMLILAKWQPVASDLRFITLALKMVTDLERIGDLTVNICERAIDLSREPPLKPYIEIPQMAQLVESMIKDAVDAFVSQDATKAQAVIARDDEVDELYSFVFKELITIIAQDESHVRRGIHIQSVAKGLERMADHCTNLAEQVVFMVKGHDIRHVGKLGE